MLKLLSSGVAGGADRPKSFRNQQPVEKRLPGEKLSFTFTNMRQMSQNKTKENVFCFQKDLVSEMEDDGKSWSRTKDTRELSISLAAENIWKKHLDPRLMSGGTSGLHGSKEIAQLACRCLDRRRKKRPKMTEVERSGFVLFCFLFNFIIENFQNVYYLQICKL